MDKYIEQQQLEYKIAYQEILKGRKESHWIWYIFPQIKGLGKSFMCKKYDIQTLDEAKQYLDNDYLRNNLIRICEALLTHEGKKDIEDIMNIDDVKLLSSMTLFNKADEEKKQCKGIFKRVLDVFYQGREDEFTLKILEEEAIIKNEQEKLKKEEGENEQKLPRLENERKEKEKIEKERIEREKLERERIEREKLERERIEREKFERERIEREKLEGKEKEIKKLEMEKQSGKNENINMNNNSKKSKVKNKNITNISYHDKDKNLYNQNINNEKKWYPNSIENESIKISEIRETNQKNLNINRTKNTNKNNEGIKLYNINYDPWTNNKTSINNNNVNRNGVQLPKNENNNKNGIQRRRYNVSQDNNINSWKRQNENIPNKNNMGNTRHSSTIQAKTNNRTKVKEKNNLKGSNIGYNINTQKDNTIYQKPIIANNQKSKVKPPLYQFHYSKRK